MDDTELLARKLAYSFYYKQFKQHCSNPTATHETWDALARHAVNTHWMRFTSEVELMNRYESV